LPSFAGIDNFLKYHGDIMSILRPLTEGEIRLARSVFGDAIDYAKVHISDGRYSSLQSEDSAMMGLDGNIYMNKAYTSDYSIAGAIWQGYFIHEMTHVWQYQNKVLHPLKEAVSLMLKHKFNYRAAYGFRLEEGKDLTQYGMEQQAAIVAEYFMTQRAHWTFYGPDCENRCTPAEKKDLFEKVLDKFLKNPAYARKPAF
jgi:hypothetical protein